MHNSMETKHNIIRRALAQAPGTALPEGFGVRLMERLQRESARRERRETWLLGTAGVLCLLAVIAGLGWYFFYEPETGLQLPGLPRLPEFPDLPVLPEFPDLPTLPDLSGLMEPAKTSAPSAQSRSLYHACIFIATAFLCLSGIDLYLRKRWRQGADRNTRPH